MCYILWEKVVPDCLGYEAKASTLPLSTFQIGKSKPKPKFDFNCVNANTKSDLTKAQAKFGEPDGCKDC